MLSYISRKYQNSITVNNILAQSLKIHINIYFTLCLTSHAYSFAQYYFELVLKYLNVAQFMEKKLGCSFEYCHMQITHLLGSFRL